MLFPLYSRQFLPNPPFLSTQPWLASRRAFAVGQVRHLALSLCLFIESLLHIGRVLTLIFSMGMTPVSEELIYYSKSAGKFSLSFFLKSELLKRVLALNIKYVAALEQTLSFCVSPESPLCLQFSWVFLSGQLYWTYIQPSTH